MNVLIVVAKRAELTLADSLQWNIVLGSITNSPLDEEIILPTSTRPMDAIDRKILTLLQQDVSRSVAEIGSLVGLSSTPCWKRIQRLESDEVIQKRVALVDQDKVGLGVTVFVSIETGDHSQGWLDRFADEVGAMPEVMEFYRMAGDVDYMLRVVVPDIQGYDEFYKRLIAAVPLKNVTSRFAMEKIKATTALPIPEDAERKAGIARRRT